MQQNDYLNDIAKKFENKYSAYVEIYRLTQELEEVLRSNDKDSIGMVMKMRGEEMDRVNSIDHEIEELYPFITQQQINYIQNYKDYDKFPEELEKIINIKKRSFRMLEKIIEIDKRLNTRLTGKKSFYGGN